MYMNYEFVNEEDEKVKWEVEYRPSHYAPEKTSGHPDTWHEAESEDTEITAVVDATGVNIVSTLDKQMLEQIEIACEKDQKEYCEY